MFISQQLINFSSYKTTVYGFNFSISGMQLYIPYRIYTILEISNLETALLMTRHSDGFTRQKALLRVLEEKQLEIFVVPYLALLLSEYVLEIALIIIKDNRTKPLLDKLFMEENNFYKLFKSKIISYWGEYYRNEFYFFKDYPLNQLLDSLEQTNPLLNKIYKSQKKLLT